LHPSFLTMYWLGLLTVHNHTPYPNITDDLPPILRLAVQHQSRLGWEQLYHGWLAQDWARAIDQLNPTIAPSGAQILVYMTQAVWTYVLNTWRLRNQHLHQDAGLLSLPDYKQAVTMAYESGQQLPPEAQEALFHQPLDLLLEQPLSILCTWLKCTHKYMKQQFKAAKTHTKLNTLDICSFFQPCQPPANDLHPL